MAPLTGTAAQARQRARRDHADKLFSAIVRARAGRCENCGAAGGFDANRLPTKGLTCAHIKEAIVIKSGERKLVYEETIQAKAGQRGDLEVPDHLTLALAVFEGEGPQTVQARLRFRITPNGLRIIVVLDRPDDIVRDGFQSLVDEIASELGPVWMGTPPA